MKFKEVFSTWIESKVNDQINLIDKIASDLNIDMKKWFHSYFLKRTSGYTDTDFLDELLSEFLFYLDTEFCKVLLTYIPPSGKNIYGEPCLSLDFNLICDKDRLNLKRKHAKNFENLVNTLSLSQKQELMKNNLFCYVVNQTNLKIYNNNDIRVLKLKTINEKMMNEI